MIYTLETNSLLFSSKDCVFRSAPREVVGSREGLLVPLVSAVLSLEAPLLAFAPAPVRLLLSVMVFLVPSVLPELLLPEVSVVHLLRLLVSPLPVLVSSLATPVVRLAVSISVVGARLVSLIVSPPVLGVLLRLVVVLVAAGRASLAVLVLVWPALLSWRVFSASRRLPLLAVSLELWFALIPVPLLLAWAVVDEALVVVCAILVRAIVLSTLVLALVVAVVLSVLGALKLAVLRPVVLAIVGVPLRILMALFGRTPVVVGLLLGGPPIFAVAVLVRPPVLVVAVVGRSPVIVVRVVVFLPAVGVTLVVVLLAGVLVVSASLFFEGAIVAAEFRIVGAFIMELLVLVLPLLGTPPLLLASLRVVLAELAVILGRPLVLVLFFGGGRRSLLVCVAWELLIFVATVLVRTGVLFPLAASALVAGFVLVALTGVGRLLRPASTLGVLVEARASCSAASEAALLVVLTTPLSFVLLASFLLFDVFFYSGLKTLGLEESALGQRGHKSFFLFQGFRRVEGQAGPKHWLLSADDDLVQSLEKGLVAVFEIDRFERVDLSEAGDPVANVLNDLDNLGRGGSNSLQKDLFKLFGP